MAFFPVAAAVLLGCALFVHFRGRERLAFRRQLTDHSTFVAPYNALVYLFSAVPRGPILDADDFPELAPLRENWKILRDEALRLHEQGAIRPAERRDDVAFNSFFKRGWTRFYLSWYGDFLPSAQALCPRSVELVRGVPEVRAALFAFMPPRSHTGRHRDPFAGSLRYHLGLVTPSDDACRIEIDGEPYSWRDGEGVVFDETFIHRAVNETDEPRIILFCDVERPLRTRAFRRANRWVADHVVPLTAARNEEDEPIGLANRVSRHVHALGQHRRRFKREHRSLYRAARIALVALLAALVVSPWLPR